MPTRLLPLLLLSLLALPGCDKIKAMSGGGGPDPKVLDAEAVGYACRVSQKAPEDCMKENDAHSPSSVLSGWKKADGEIKAGHIDPTMSNVVPQPASAVAATEDKHEEEAASTEEAATEKSSDKKEKAHETTKSGKAEKSAKPEAGAHETDKSAAAKPTDTSHESKPSNRKPAEKPAADSSNRH